MTQAPMRRRAAQRQPSQPRHGAQRRLATFLLILVAACGIALFDARQTVFNADFTTKTLTSSTNLPTLTTQLQKGVSAQLTSVPGAGTVAKHAIDDDTTKALVKTAVANIYSDDDTNSIDFSRLDAAVKSALNATGLGSVVSTSLTTELLTTLHNYFNRQLASTTSAARTEYQTASKRAQTLTIATAIIAVLLLVWLLVACGWARCLHALGWASLVAGILGWLASQAAAKLQLAQLAGSLTANFQTVATNYLEQVISHLGTTFALAAAAGLVVWLITWPLTRRR